jgi:intermediate peptidase
MSSSRCLLPVVLSRGPTTTIRPTTPFGLAVAVQWVNVLSKRNASSNIRNKYRRAFGGISSTSSLAVVPSSPLGGIRTTTTTTKTDKHGAKEQPGLFSIVGLNQPHDFIELAKQAMNRCDAIRYSLHQQLLSAVGDNEVDADSTANSVETARHVLMELDAISNHICSVIDAAELCRCVHSSEQWRICAEGAFELLSDYMADLNTDQHLYDVLCQSISSPPQVFHQLTEEEQRFATLLKAEFERDGIHLSTAERKHIKHLQTAITHLETKFSSNITRHKKYFHASPAEDVYAILPRHIIQEFVPPQQQHQHHIDSTDSKSNGDSTAVMLSSDSQLVNSILKYSSNPSLRKQVYMEAHTACPENIQVLEELRKVRHELAVTLGYSSYAERFLHDKMAKTPQTVQKFLNNMSQRIKPFAQRDYETLLEAKRYYEGTTNSTLEPWDIAFYTNLVKSKSHGFDSSTLIPYFSIENCLEGISLLVKHLFGIQLVQEEAVSSTELWSPTVRKLSLHHEVEGNLGIIYLDLLPRPDKYVHAAHFTIRCGCAVYPNGASVHDTSNSNSTSPSSASNFGEKLKFQLPVVALVTNLSTNSSSSSDTSANSSNPNLLTHSEVETLFHELGHALHSLLSRTKFQHLSGTRCAVDFVETPSHLMENFCWDERFVQMFAKHYLSKVPLPDELAKKLANSRCLFQNLEIQNQIVYAQLDQAIFGLNNHITTVEIFEELHRRHSIPYAKGTHWHTKFGHLISYGAGYYGYLFDQVFAADIWEECFRANPLSRSSGDKLRNNILIHGGAMDPEKMLMGMLGRASTVDAFFNNIS